MTVPSDGYCWVTIIGGVGITDAFSDFESARTHAHDIVKGQCYDVFVGLVQLKVTRMPPAAEETRYGL